MYNLLSNIAKSKLGECLKDSLLENIAEGIGSIAGYYAAPCIAGVIAPPIIKCISDVSLSSTPFMGYYITKGIVKKIYPNDQKKATLALLAGTIASSTALGLIVPHMTLHVLSTEMVCNTTISAFSYLLSTAGSYCAIKLMGSNEKLLDVQDIKGSYFTKTSISMIAENFISINSNCLPVDFIGNQIINAITFNSIALIEKSRAIKERSVLYGVLPSDLKKAPIIGKLFDNIPGVINYMIIGDFNKYLNGLSGNNAYTAQMNQLITLHISLKKQEDENARQGILDEIAATTKELGNIVALQMQQQVNIAKNKKLLGSIKNILTNLSTSPLVRAGCHLFNTDAFVDEAKERIVINEVSEDKIQEFTHYISNVLADIEKDIWGITLSSEVEAIFLKNFFLIHLPNFILYAALDDLITHCDAVAKVSSIYKADEDTGAYRCISGYKIFCDIKQLTHDLKVIQNTNLFEREKNTVDLYKNLLRFTSEYYIVATSGIGRNVMEYLVKEINIQIDNSVRY